MNEVRARGWCCRRGVTLLELVVSIGIIAVLMGILVPVLREVRQTARGLKCQSNARQILTGINASIASSGSRLPENRSLVEPGKYVTWRHRLAEAYGLGEDEVWACPLHKRGPRGEEGFTERGSLCVGDVASSYALNGHVLWRGEKGSRDSVVSDTAIRRPSHTILLAETNRRLADLRVSPPIVANYYGDEPGPFSYWHSGAGVYGFQDGHVEVVPFLETGSPDCRWHNGPDLTDDPFVPQKAEEIPPHSHEEWAFLVPGIYLD